MEIRISFLSNDIKEHLLVEVHVIVDHTIAETDSLHEGLTGFIANEPDFVHDDKGVAASCRHHRAVEVPKYAPCLADGILDQDLQRSAGSPKLDLVQVPFGNENLRGGIKHAFFRFSRPATIIQVGGEGHPDPLSAAGIFP